MFSAEVMAETSANHLPKERNKYTCEITKFFEVISKTPGVNDKRLSVAEGSSAGPSSSSQSNDEGLWLESKDSTTAPPKCGDQKSKKTSRLSRKKHEKGNDGKIAPARTLRDASPTGSVKNDVLKRKSTAARRSSKKELAGKAVECRDLNVDGDGEKQDSELGNRRKKHQDLNDGDGEKPDSKLGKHLKKHRRKGKDGVDVKSNRSSKCETSDGSGRHARKMPSDEARVKRAVSVDDKDGVLRHGGRSSDTRSASDKDVDNTNVTVIPCDDLHGEVAVVGGAEKNACRLNKRSKKKSTPSKTGVFSLKEDLGIARYFQRNSKLSVGGSPTGKDCLSLSERGAKRKIKNNGAGGTVSKKEDPDVKCSAKSGAKPARDRGKSAARKLDSRKVKSKHVDEDKPQLPANYSAVHHFCHEKKSTKGLSCDSVNVGNGAGKTEKVSKVRTKADKMKGRPHASPLRSKSIGDAGCLRRSPRVKMSDKPKESCDDNSASSAVRTPAKRKKSKTSKRSRAASVDSSKDVYKVSLVVGGRRCGDRRGGLKLRLTRVGCGSDEVVFIKARKLISRAKKASTGVALAPIFTKFADAKKARKATAHKMDAATLRRRRKFLMSGIPEKLRERISSARAREQLIGCGCFPSVGHVKQQSDAEHFWNLSRPAIFDKIRGGDRWTEVVNLTSDWQLGGMSSVVSADFQRRHVVQGAACAPVILSEEKVRELVSAIKTEHPDVDVSDIFHSCLAAKGRLSYALTTCVTAGQNAVADIRGTSKRARHGGSGLSGDVVRRRDLKSADSSELVEGSSSDEVHVLHERDARIKEKRFARVDERPSSDRGGSESALPWATVYQPESVRDIVGSAGAVKRLKEWLSSWKRENIRRDLEVRKRKLKLDAGSDSERSSGADDGICNAVLLVGPTGSGKTSAVYSLAKRLGFKVLEVNASSRRTGKIVLEQLQEATQSHQVSDGVVQEKPLKGIASFFLSGNDGKSGAKVQRPKRDGDNKRKRVENRSKPVPTSSELSLILFEDIDLLFADDDGFLGAVNTIMATAKRPVILTSSDVRFGRRGRIREDYEEIAFEAVDLRRWAVRLRLMCLAGSHLVSGDDVRRLALRNHSDLRRSIVELQFWCQSNGRSESSEPRTAGDAFSAAFGCFGSGPGDGLCVSERCRSWADDIFCERLPRCLGVRSFEVPFRPGDKPVGRIVVRKWCDEAAVDGRREAIAAASTLLDDCCIVDRFGVFGRRSDSLACGVMAGLDDGVRTDDDDDWNADHLASEMFACLTELRAGRASRILGRMECSGGDASPDQGRISSKDDDSIKT